MGVRPTKEVESTLPKITPAKMDLDSSDAKRMRDRDRKISSSPSYTPPQPVRHSPEETKRIKEREQIGSPEKPYR